MFRFAFGHLSSVRKLHVALCTVKPKSPQTVPGCGAPYAHALSTGTVSATHAAGGALSVASKRLAWATVAGHRCLRAQDGQHKACDAVAERGRE
jgi:hypothetical protein